jgi:hypothetical protein
MINLTPEQRILNSKKKYRESHREELRSKSKNYYAKNRLVICKRNRKNYQIAFLKNPDKIREQGRINSKRNPQKKRTPLQSRAQYLALTRIPVFKCEVCGATEKLQRHHPDYSKPLEVQILCAHCHIVKHRGLPEEGIKND